MKTDCFKQEFYNKLKGYLSLIIVLWLLLSSPMSAYTQNVITPRELEDSIEVKKYHGSYLVSGKDYESLIHFHHGLKDGQWVTAYFNRDMKVETYKKGRKDGLWIWRSRYGGFCGKYKNDRKVGLWSEGYEEENIGYYKRGLKEGKWKYSHFGSGVVTIEEYKKGKKNGIWKYYLNDTLLQNEIYKNDSLIMKEKLFPAGIYPVIK